MSHKLEPELRKRLRFIEGQSRGVQRMLDEDRDIADILIQLMAIQSAAKAAAELVVRDRIAGRIKETIHRAVLSCIGECEMCDELEGLSHALEELDYASVLEDLTKLRGQ